MAVPSAYGDSGVYFRTVQGSDTGQQLANIYTPLYHSPQSINQWTMVDLMRNMSAYQAVTHVKSEPIPPSRSTVIRDRGFGGGDSRPRSRRHRDPK